MSDQRFFNYTKIELLGIYNRSFLVCRKKVQHIRQKDVYIKNKQKKLKAGVDHWGRDSLICNTSWSGECRDLKGSRTLLRINQILLKSTLRRRSNYPLFGGGHHGKIILSFDKNSRKLN